MFFMKVKLVFSETSYKLSTRCVFIFQTTIIFVLIGLAIGIIIKVMNFVPSIVLLIYTMFWIIIIVAITISEVILFTYKLLIVYKQSVKNKNKDDEILDAITKASVLNILSVSFTLINLAVYLDMGLIRKGIFTGRLYILGGYVMIFDIYTNFVCIIFISAPFKRHYSAICKYSDLCIRCCCKSLCIKKEVEIIQPMQEIIQYNANAKHSAMNTSSAVNISTTMSVWECNHLIFIWVQTYEPKWYCLPTWLTWSVWIFANILKICSIAGNGGSQLQSCCRIRVIPKPRRRPHLIIHNIIHNQQHVAINILSTSSLVINQYITPNKLFHKS